MSACCHTAGLAWRDLSICGTNSDGLLCQKLPDLALSRNSLTSSHSEKTHGQSSIVLTSQQFRSAQQPAVLVTVLVLVQERRALGCGDLETPVWPCEDWGSRAWLMTWLPEICRLWRHQDVLGRPAPLAVDTGNHTSLHGCQETPVRTSLDAGETHFPRHLGSSVRLASV